MKRLEIEQMEVVNGGFGPLPILKPSFLCALENFIMFNSDSLEQLEYAEALEKLYGCLG